MNYAQWVTEKNSNAGPPVFKPSAGVHPPLEATQLPGVPAHVPALLVHGLLSKEECQTIIQAVPWEGKGYMSLEEVTMMYRGRISHRYLAFDSDMSSALFSRLKSLLPAKLDGGELVEISPEWRVLKYEPGGLFDPHIDGREPGQPERRCLGQPSRECFLQSRLTIQIYLNDHGEEFTGGEFVVFDRERPSKHSFVLQPKAGDAVVFYQEILDGSQDQFYMLHSAEPVDTGVRYAMRAMVQYAFEDAGTAQHGATRE